MNQKIANKITAWSLGEETDRESDEFQIVSYGILLAIETIYKAAVLLLLGWLIGYLPETAAFLLSFCGLRKLAGGFHMQTSMGCMGMVTLFWGISLFLSGFSFPLVLQGLLFIGTFLLVYIYAPCDTRNNPITDARVRKRKRLCSLVFLSGMTVAAMLICREGVGNVILVAMAIEALTTIHRRRIYQ
jgi:accessory gene regulator B